MFFKMLYDDKLAQASYMIGCQRTHEALVIDPQRDVDRYLNLAENEGLKITAITETHIHADFLSGAREMAERTEAKLYLSDEGDADSKYQWLEKKKNGGKYDYQLLYDGDTFTIGNIEFKTLHTPGHTPEHISFMVTDLGSGATEPMGIATGNFVFVGDVGMPDLQETAAGIARAKEKSARALFRSLQKFKSFPDYLQIWPGHGSGSAFGKSLGAVPQSTVGYEKRFNATIQDANNETIFIQNLIYGQPELPLYFDRMKRYNKENPAILGNLPSLFPMSIEKLTHAIAENTAVLDTRPWEQFAEGHLPEAIHSPLDNSFPTVVGSYVEENTPILLIIEKDRVNEAVVDLIRIGLDNIAGYITPQSLAEYAKKGSALQTTAVKQIDTLKNQIINKNVLILDVRRADEFHAGHLPGAKNIAHTRLLARLDEVPKDHPIWVYCRTSIRSAYSAGFLQSKGFDITMLDGGFKAWSKVNGKIVKEEPEWV